MLVFAILFTIEIGQQPVKEKDGMSKVLLTLALAGVVVDATPPPEVFLRCTLNYEVDRAEILHSLWGILCAAFGKEN